MLNIICEHCGEPIFGDSCEVMGCRMHFDCAKEFHLEFDAWCAETEESALFNGEIMPDA